MIAAVTFIVRGIAATWIIDFYLFGARGLRVRNHPRGIAFSGLVTAGIAGAGCKQVEEARTPEKIQNRRRMA